jgi:hypothetical protein
MLRRNRKQFLHRRRQLFLESLEERAMLTGYGDIGIALHDLVENNGSQLLIEATVTRAIDEETEEEIPDDVKVYYTLGSAVPNEATAADYSVNGSSGYFVIEWPLVDGGAYVTVNKDTVWDPNDIVTVRIDRVESDLGVEYDPGMTFPSDPIITTIQDTNGPHISVTATGNTSEVGGMQKFIVTRELPALGNLHVDLVDLGSTAWGAIDYDGTLNTEGLELGFGNGEWQKELTVIPIHDCREEVQNETINIGVLAQTDPYVTEYLVGSSPSASITISDIDNPPLAELTNGGFSSVPEEIDGQPYPASFQVTLRCWRDGASPGLY